MVTFKHMFCNNLGDYTMSSNHSASTRVSSEIIVFAVVFAVVAVVLFFSTMSALEKSLGGPLAVVSYDGRGRIQCHAVEIPQGESFRYEKCPSDWRRFGQSEVGPNWKPPR